MAVWYFNANTNHYKYTGTPPGVPWVTSIPSLSVMSAAGSRGRPVIPKGLAQGAAGTAIIVTGTGFGDAATVTIGGVTATPLVINSTILMATSGAHAPGVVNIVVTNPDGGTSTLTNGYTYLAASTGTSIVVPGDFNTKSWGLQQCALKTRTEETS